MDKGEYRRAAAELGIAIVCPDSSPRGDDVPDDKADWTFGSGAGFYVDATREPYAANYQMASYVRDELPDVVTAHFPVDMVRQGIFGHSMGGHGALTLALKSPGRFRSVSAFAPICRLRPAGRGRRSKGTSATTRGDGERTIPSVSSRMGMEFRNSWSIREHATNSLTMDFDRGFSKKPAKQRESI